MISININICVNRGVVAGAILPGMVGQSNFEWVCVLKRISGRAFDGKEIHCEIT